MRKRKQKSGDTLVKRRYTAVQTCHILDDENNK